MAFVNTDPVFRDDEIIFVEPVESKLQNVVGGVAQATGIVKDAAEFVGTSDFDAEYSSDKDLIDRALEKRLGVISNRLVKAQGDYKLNKKRYKRLREEEQNQNQSVSEAQEENIYVHRVFDEKNDLYQDAKREHFQTDWSKNHEGETASRFKLEDAKKEATKAYKDVQLSNKKLNDVAERRKMVISKEGQILSQKAETKKNIKTHERKIIVLKTILNAKDGIRNIDNQSPDDLVAAGQKGLAGSVLRAINPIEVAKLKFQQALAGLISSVLSVLIPMVLKAFLTLLLIVMLVAALFHAFSPIISGITNLAGAQYDSLFSDDEVQDKILERGYRWEYDRDEEGNIIESTGRRVSTLPETTQNLMRYAFSKVGYPYSQELRSSGTHYDCSSLAYYTEACIGKDITCSTAAGQAKKLYREHKNIPLDSNLQIGDLIYYGGRNNGRYLGIYHVAIYVGNGYCVEAYNHERGVIYAPARYKNVCMICRP